ncbi:MAG: hypothetical protein RLN89_10340 [Parvibaculum sp.]
MIIELKLRNTIVSPACHRCEPKLLPFAPEPFQQDPSRMFHVNECGHS